MNNTTLILTAPEFSALEPTALRQQPAALWPVGSQSLAAHWLDHAVRTGCKRVILHASAQPALISRHLGDGAYWSLQLEVSADPAPPEAIPLLGLPGEAARSTPQTRPELLQWWLELNMRWLVGRNASAVSIDQPRERDGWVAPRAKIHPSAKLVPPYRIGADTEIGPDCRIGPFAVIGDGCLLESDVQVVNGLVLDHTFLGPHLDVVSRIIEGGTMLDIVSGARIEITDKFIASQLAQAHPVSAAGDMRATGAAPGPLTRLLAFFRGAPAPARPPHLVETSLK